jgi:hypothetical protein
MGQGALSAIACLPSLQLLRIEDLHCRVDKDSLAELGNLTQVRPPGISKLSRVSCALWQIGSSQPDACEAPAPCAPARKALSVHIEGLCVASRPVS